MEVFFTNLGCKLNQAEVEKFAREFRAAGHRIVGSLEEATLHVVNSCTVTHVAARDSRKTARRGQRLAGARIRTVLTGCYASGSPEEAARLAGVDLVVANDRKDDLVELVHEAFPEEVPLRASHQVPVSYVPLPFMNTRAAVKIEDGCNMRCSFCIIPLTRGRQRSRPIEEVLSEVRTLVAGGAEEVIVTGVQISSYRDRDARLADLVTKLLSETEVPRLRLTSIAPWQFDERLFELFAHERLCRHVHLSLQSGCDATLERMRRPYDTTSYALLLDRLRSSIPGVAITTDVIVGFPGETDAEFEHSLAFVERADFAKVHAFTYSEREGTLATGLPDPVPIEKRKERIQRMRRAAAEAECSFALTQVGERASVLWEEQREDLWRGMTDNYLKVLSRSRPERSLELRVLERLDQAGVWVDRQTVSPVGARPLELKSHCRDVEAGVDVVHLAGDTLR